ncbi:MAG: ABC transporter substrate-binding protein [Selenomonadaceae bacterium]
MNEEGQHKKSCGCNNQNKSINKTVENKILLALLPCGIRNAFVQTLQNKFPEIIDNEKYIIDGNLNYEKSFYDQLDKENGFAAIPEIFISSDINSLYHQSFIQTFMNDNYFDRIQPQVPALFQKEAFVHPTGHMCWFTTNLLVVVADLEKVHEDLLPQSWADLLNKIFVKGLSLRGDDDFFCNAILYPYMKAYGKEAITQLGQNTLVGLHPSQMIKTINAGNANGSPLYVMPYSFALKIRNTERFKTIFPIEGPIVSPVQLMLKKGAYQKHKTLIDFILGKEMGEVLNRSGFPTLTSANMPNLNKLNWVGWDFILENDIASCKDELQELFYKGYKPVK